MGVKAINDETVIAALLLNGTVRSASKALGLSERRIFARFRNHDFVSMYKDARTDIIREAVFSINSKLSSAIETVSQIMSDAKVNAAVRLQAAQTILNCSSKFSKHLTDFESQYDFSLSTFWK